jgi:hypothetical protein
MTIKEYLNQARMLDKRIDSKLEQVERLRALAERTTTDLSSQPKGTSGTNRTEYCVQKIWELEREINADIDKLIDLKRDIQDVLTSLPEQQCRVMCAYYVDLAESWSDAAEKSGYSYKHARRIRDAAKERLDNDHNIWYYLVQGGTID